MPKIGKSSTLYDQIRAGTILVNNRSPLELRFWKNVDKNGPVHPIVGQCWQWVGHKYDKGYGRIMVNRRLDRANRVSWMLHFGEISDGLRVLHHCDNPSCVRPDHLFLGTDADNSKDKCLKERCGPRVRLTNEQVRQIRRRYRRGTEWRGKGGNTEQLAKEYDVSAQVIRGVVAGRSYIYANNVEASPVMTAAAGT